MKILVIQCYEGNLNGEICIEHVKNRKYFYYNFKEEALKFEKVPKGKNVSQDNYVLIVQFDRESKKICGMSNGIYHKLKTDKKKQINDLLKISDIKEINFEHYEDVRSIIKEIDVSKLNNKCNHNLFYINIDEGDFNEFNNIVNGDELNQDNKEKEYDPKILDSYKKFESNLCTLAQRSRYAERVIDKMPRRENRTEYQRDWERIVHSKAFRRLEDKAQIYTLAKGDHFRTRLTHTLEVTQIARGLARELQLNEDLVEAIALGHDLGHTPFGHVGERTLHEILEKEGKVKQIGGFKHNYQGVRVVNCLEEKYGGFEGLNLTYQVMEGILKHTSTFECENRDGCNDCQDKCYIIDEFLCKGDIKKLYLNYNFCVSLEGQVVALADEIAQRAHDLDDGIASGIINVDEFLKNLKKDDDFRELSRRIDDCLIHIKEGKQEYINVNEFLKSLEEDCDYEKIQQTIHNYLKNIEEDKQDSINIKKFLESLQKDDCDDEKLREKIYKFLKYIKEEKRDYIDVLDIKRARIVSEVITYFMQKLVEHTDKKITDYAQREGINDKTLESLSELIISEEIVGFDSDTEKVREKLKDITSNKIINSEEVNCFDGKGAYIIRKLYKAYYANPRQMPTTTLKRIYREISKYTNDIVDIRDGKRELVKNEIEIYRGNDIDNDLKKLKHKIFIRCIVDLIAGMTDDFANKQFEKLYSPRTY